MAAMPTANAKDPMIEQGRSSQMEPEHFLEICFWFIFIIVSGAVLFGA
jgi:hypothetical protein